MKICTLSTVVAAVLVSGVIQAQQPTPPIVIVQPAGAAANPAPARAAASPSDNSIATAIKALEEVKAANEATLKKQEAMLQQLDELQKAAEQLKVFSKRV